MSTGSSAHVATDRTVVGREDERASIFAFVEDCEVSKLGKTMYVCGSPGVGKTLCVQKVLQEWHSNRCSPRAAGRRFDYLNVIGLNDHLKVFTAIETLIKGKSFVSQIKKRGRKTVDDIGETFAQVSDCIDSVVATAKEHCAKETTCVFVLDEIDYLCPSLSAVTRGGNSKSSLAARRQLDLITSLFALPESLASTKCCLIVIGIANSIDLSNKIGALANSTRSARRKPLIDSTLVFKPYSASELKSIVNKMTDNSLDQVAVEICSRKVAALHGDCRKVIDLCKQAKSSSKAKNGDGNATIQDLMGVMEAAYKSQAESSSTLKSLPLQQLLVLVAACRYANSHSDRTEFAVPDLKMALSTLIAEMNIPSIVVGQMTSLIEHMVALSNSGLMTVRVPTAAKRGMWRLNCHPDQLEDTLKKTNALVARALGGTGEESIPLRE